MLEAELLRSELEVTQQQLEGKYEALKILQDMAVLDKATVHTKTLLQKTGERNKILEKEVNILQWENDFKQDKFKHLEQFWVERLERTCIENTELAKKLEARDGEIRDLKSENTLLSQQCSELLAMLNIKDQHTFEKMLPANMNGFTEITALELGVLGACHCNGIGAEPCGCARMAAATRRQLLGLQQEIDLQRKREEEAHLMADAFRSAFEHQLKRTNDQTLRITEVGKLHRKYLKKGLVWTQSKGDPAYKTEVNHITLGQRLKGLFNSSADYKKLEVLDDPQEVLRMLIDLVCMLPILPLIIHWCWGEQIPSTLASDVQVLNENLLNVIFYSFNIKGMLRVKCYYNILQMLQEQIKSILCSFLSSEPSSNG